MKRRIVVGGIVAITLVQLLVLSAFTSDAEVWLASDKNGQNRVTNVQEGGSIWICVYDPDENVDSDVQDKIWTDVKVMDPNTGAYIVWKSYADATGNPGGQQYDDPNYVPYKGHSPGPAAGWTGSDYLEETAENTGVFVSSRSFQIGARVDSVVPQLNTHSLPPTDFQWGNHEYVDGIRGWFDSDGVFTPGLMSSALPVADTVCPGKVENMDTLVLIYSDPNDDKDVAVSMAKIVDTESKIAWDSGIYRDARGAATITVTDPDENLDFSKVEYAPVFILVNPGSWNPVDAGNKSANDFWMLQRYGGVSDVGATAKVGPGPIDWFSIYDSGSPALALGAQPTVEGSYYVQYPRQGIHTNVSYFDTLSATGVARVMFYAQETGANTGVFEIHLSGICRDLGFNSLQIGDVLVAYYEDPNDEDDFSLGAAYVGMREHVSTTSFTDYSQVDKSIYWIGRDLLYVEVNDKNANTDPGWFEQVVAHISNPHSGDSEWLILDERSSNSPVFFTNAGTELVPVWNGMGVGTNPTATGGYQLQLDNWKIEAYNEDHIYVQYNDVCYATDETGMGGLMDISTSTAFPSKIDSVRMANDVSFGTMSIGDTQVYNGSTVNMYFLDRQGNRVNGYVNSDCVFIEVVDPDQNEDALRRERVDAYWDGGQNLPFGPFALNGWNCGPSGEAKHPLNALLGDTNIFGDGDRAGIYVLNPRSGYWAALDLLETGVASGDFVSAICVDMVNVYTCVPTLGALPGDTIVAFYQDPSNHSDSAMISIKVGVGGGTTPPSQTSVTTFTNATGVAVANYTDADLVYVKVVDPSHAGATTLANAVTIGAVAYSLAPLAGATNDTFITTGLDLNLTAGTSITATYKDPNDPTDTSTDTITVIASKLDVTSFYAEPNPSAGDVTFAYKGSGIASVMSVAVYDLAGHLVWASELANVTKIVWNGKDDSGAYVRNGRYLYFVTATDGTDTFPGNGILVINR